MTGAVASKRVTEALKAWLSTDGNRALSANAQARLTARPTGRAGTKVRGAIFVSRWGDVCDHAGSRVGDVGVRRC